MTLFRRQLLATCGLAALATFLPSIAQIQPQEKSIIKPPRLKVGDTVGLINPAGFTYQKEIEPFLKILPKLGLNVKYGAHFFDRYGYLAGSDADRAADVNTMFADPSIQAIFAGMGGWGCNRILPLLDYELIRNHPKIIMGYSDLTSLLLAIYAKSNIVTFHGPLLVSKWNPFTVTSAQKALFNREPFLLQNLNTVPIQTIAPGKTRGRLIGGNLSVLTAMIGSSYLPDWKQSILFVEEIGEEVYRIDRMLTQLKLAGILDKISGFIFGQCSHCDPEKPQESLTLMQVLSDHILPLKIPAWYGSMIGHVRDIFTVPVGAEVEIDASAGTIQLLESAVA
ncbi:MAG: S66 peptidase family protein [Actinomycetota bacterium]